MKKTILALLLAVSLLLAGCGAPDLGSAVSEYLSVLIEENHRDRTYTIERLSALL